VTVEPLGRFVYVVNAGSTSEVNGSISAYHIDANGALTPLAASPFITGINPLSVAVDLLGRFVYVANFPTQASYPSSNISKHLGLSHRSKGGPDTRRRVTLHRRDQSLLRGGGTFGSVRLRGKHRGQRRPTASVSMGP
jgi:6-phosphogluconolactonase (cycloisomerase 2 family)